MPDFDTRVTFTCGSNEYWRREVKGQGGTYVVEWCRQPANSYVVFDWQCSCKGFQFRHQCKHVEKVKAERCGWNAELEVTAEVAEIDGEFRCPDCGGPVIPVRVAV